jgi:hypothetical protein
MALFGSAFDLVDKYILGYALGTAAGPALRPFVQDLANEAWTLNPVMRVDPLTAAAVVAEDVKLRAWGADEALNHGIDGDRFDALVGETLNAPGLEQLYLLWRRGLIDDAGFAHGLRKGKLETRWDAALAAAHDVLLDPAELANARQQGFIGATRQRDEALLQGVTAERADIQFELAGLPPGIETALEMLRRKIIDSAQFAEIVRTGHTKTKWTAELEAMQARVLNATTYAGLHLRGWISEQEMVTGGELTGYDQAQMDLLFKEHGRPATGHQVLVGLRRGGVYDGPLTGIPQPFIDAIRQSNIRPEWTNILWHAVVVYPPLFQLTRLVQAGVIDATTAADWSYKSGEAQEVVTELEAYWSQTKATTGDPLVKSARTSLVTALRGAYVRGDEDQASAQAILTAEGVAQATQTELFATWDRERSITRKELTPAQLKKAYTQGTINPATGTAFTQDEAIAELVTRGYSSADAKVFLTT